MFKGEPADPLSALRSVAFMRGLHRAPDMAEKALRCPCISMWYATMIPGLVVPPQASTQVSVGIEWMEVRGRGLGVWRLSSGYRKCLQ